MLRSLRDLCGFNVQAIDGELGRADDFLFDEAGWTVRYLVVRIGGWLVFRKVLISITSVSQPGSIEIPLNLTKEQVENSPVVDTSEEISRQNEIELHDYYGWSYYWSYPSYLSSLPSSMYPEQQDQSGDFQNSESENELPGHEDVGRLRSCKEIKGYHVQASDGRIGHVADYIADDRDWVIRYLVIDTSNWLHGKEVLIAPTWISEISWDEATVYTSLSINKIRHSPPFDPSSPVNRDYEDIIYDYYGRPKYWDKKN